MAGVTVFTLITAVRDVRGTGVSQGDQRNTFANAGDGWIMALRDGSVVAHVQGGTDRVLLPPWTERPSEDAVGLGQTLGSREVAFDPATRRLWYSDTHDAIRSINIDTGAAGPSLRGFADLSAPGCGVTSDARHMAVDLVHRRLIVPTQTGSVLFYDLDDATMNGGLGIAFFGDIVSGGFRHFASDPGTGLAWYANARGDFIEADLMRGVKTGRIIPQTAQDHGRANAFRELAIDGHRRLLVYRTTDERLAAFDLRTLQPAAPVLADPLEGLGAIAFLPR